MDMELIEMANQVSDQVKCIDQGIVQEGGEKLEHLAMVLWLELLAAALWLVLLAAVL